MKKLTMEIQDISNEIFNMGDRDEFSNKNITNGLCSIYFYNDLSHFTDYIYNGHTLEERGEFIKLWHVILNKVQPLYNSDRKEILLPLINTNSHIYKQFLNFENTLFIDPKWENIK